MTKQSTRRHTSVRSQRSIARHEDSPAIVKEPTQKTLRLIDDVRRPFTAFVDEHSIVLESRADLAPKFVRAYDAFRTDTEQSFVAFVRLFDPEIPADREGYRNHRTYQAAEYLRRVVANQAKPALPVNKRPVTPLVALARLLATILPDMVDHEILWAAFVKEMRWSQGQVARLQTIVNREGPVNLTTSKRMAPAAPSARLALARTGTRG